MKTLAPVQIGSLGKAFFYVLAALTATWAAVSYLLFREIYVARPLLVTNLLLAAGLGWLYYRWRYHTRFAYDQVGFELQIGRISKIAGKWADYEHVSLAHLGGGQIAVRLYRPKVEEPAEASEQAQGTKPSEEFVQIPASALGLDGFALRDELMGYVAPRRSP